MSLFLGALCLIRRRDETQCNYRICCDYTAANNVTCNKSIFESFTDTAKHPSLTKKFGMLSHFLNVAIPNKFKYIKTNMTGRRLVLMHDQCIYVLHHDLRFALVTNYTSSTTVDRGRQYHKTYTLLQAYNLHTPLWHHAPEIYLAHFTDKYPEGCNPNSLIIGLNAIPRLYRQRLRLWRQYRRCRGWL